MSKASAWLNAVDGLSIVHARLKRRRNPYRDALDVIRQQDGKQTLFYLDPPYLSETEPPKTFTHTRWAQTSTPNSLMRFAVAMDDHAIPGYFDLSCTRPPERLDSP